MLKGRTIQTILLASSGTVIAALLGLMLYLAQEQGLLAEWQNRIFAEQNVPSKPKNDSNSRVLPLVSTAPEERRSQLEKIAAGRSSYDRNRARYLLANDWIEALEGGKALRLLEGLEDAYPLLAPQILLKRARAYQLTNELTQARETLEALLEAYPESPVAAEAFYFLGQSNPEYQELALAQFPNHPRTHQIARDRLDEDPNRAEMLLFLARNTPNEKGMDAIRDRLVNNHSDFLTPEDWETIADGYWQQREYQNAANAYSKAPSSAQTLYRAARGRQIAGNNPQAKLAYQELLNRFPEAEEIGQALLHLASLSPSSESLSYLQRAIAQFPDKAPEALVRKANLHETLKQGKLAGQARQTLLDNYGDSEAAAEYRWQVAKQLAAKGDSVGAWKWAHPIATTVPNSSLAPKASFWVGKWARELNRSQDAEAAFKYVLENYPESYYAWRSAAILGWDVGNFTTLRPLSPPVEIPNTRPLPPAGSDAFKELYQLGQDSDASALWQAELGSQEQDQLTVPEQFTEALLQIAREKYLQGIDLIWRLKQRDAPEDREAWQALRQQPQYWQALFPFPYYQIVLEEAQKREMNPLLVIALIRQESRFQKDIRSSAGAVGLMQVLPSTAKEVADKNEIQEYSLTNPEDNIAIGTGYLDYTHQEYQDNSLLAIASYNAGPGNVAQWVEKFGAADPDVFVEQIPFGETKGYVESVLGNYWNYLRIYNSDVARKLSASRVRSTATQQQATDLRGKAIAVRTLIGGRRKGTPIERGNKQQG